MSTTEIRRSEALVAGVRVERVRPAGDDPQRTPIVFVHGGCHGGWMWRRMLHHFAALGHDCRALSWWGHGGSDALPPEAFVQRSIGDVVREIDLVVGGVERPPILVGHSMGGLASQCYAAAHPDALAALALVTPVVPAAAAGDVIELPIEPGVPWGPPPLEVARDLFFQNMEDEEVRELHALLVPESPVAVHEATRWTLEVDVAAVAAVGPILVLAAEQDRLTPPAVVGRLAGLVGADYELFAGQGHSLPMASGWRAAADRIDGWLDARAIG
jgi:pimeloyl-ACP methyl ester carboxylesterase